MYKNTNQIGVRVEILRNGGVYTVIEPYTAPEVQMIASSALKMSMRGRFYEPEKDIRWLTDRIRPILIINGEEYPVGMFIGTTPKRMTIGGKRILQLEAYSVLYLAQRATAEPGYTIPAGTNYIGAAQEILMLSGIMPYEAEGIEKYTLYDKADWQNGTKNLNIVNDLMAEINYRDAYPDLHGVVHLKRYRRTTADDITITYRKGEYSIIAGDPQVTTDYFDKANVFRAVCSSPDFPEPLVAEVVNDDPNSPYSTANLGVRIMEIKEVESVPDYETLQEIAADMLYQSKQTTEAIEYKTALNPVHSVYDVVALDLETETGIFVETEWRMILDASGEMTHKAERVIFG